MQSLELFYSTDQLDLPPSHRWIHLFEQVTHPNYTTFVLNREREYRQGDVLTAVIQARDASGRPKTYGGDFFRAKVVSVQPREASSAGHVTDHGNGTYTVQFPLYWTGGVMVSVQLVHPSEAVMVLQRGNPPRARPYLEAELEEDTPIARQPIHVMVPRQSAAKRLPECSNKTTPDAPHQGYWSGNVWKSSVCSVRIFKKQEMSRCLAKKTVYLHGDSTLRQWYLRLVRVIPTRRRGNDHAGPATAVNNRWNIAIHYRFHGFPIQVTTVLNFRQIRYVVDELNSIRGGPNTTIVLGLWAHFTAEPLEMFRARVFAIQSAIRRLLQRSPGTRVFVRTGTTREHKHSKLEYYLLASDWLAYQVTQEIREIFRTEKNVVVLDTWDMSVCQWGHDNVHPGPAMVDSQLNMLLSHICPK
ncbi:NXPE family member 1-like [Branchiostoma floridae]|uniref:NXPE family member 1-like n=1 Tax=Branchiostoma floridae TaxID=7739 RepID=A0A9J7M5A9_BRAFL|nr:NXPE family member 1-like [Branchiostoma floridae]